MAKKQTPETRTTNEIKKVLTEHGYKFKKIYNGGISKRFDMKTKMIRFMKKPADGLGVPDLFAYSTEEESYLWIEVKSPKRVKHMSPEQKEFLAAINKYTSGQTLGICCADAEKLEEFLTFSQGKRVDQIAKDGIIYISNKTNFI